MDEYEVLEGQQAAEQKPAESEMCKILSSLEEEMRQFQEDFKKEEDCRIRLAEWRWPNGFKCIGCGSINTPYRNLKRGIFQCKDCGYQVSLTAKTIFHKTRTPLSQWFLMIFMFAKTKNKIPVVYFQRLWESKNYKAIWNMAKKVEKALDKSGEYFRLLGIEDHFVEKKDEPTPKSPKIFYKEIIGTALKGITYIVPSLQPIGFTGDFSNAQIKRIAKGLRSAQRKRDSPITASFEYRKTSSKKMGNRTFITNFAQVKGPIQPSIKESATAAFEALSVITMTFPGLRLRFVGYTIDFFCQSPEAVSDLFFLLRRYMLFPGAKRTSMKGGEFAGWREPRNINAEYLIDFIRKPKGKWPPMSVSISEAGSDATREIFENGQSGWKHSNTDRVRIEFSFETESPAIAGIRTKTPKELLFSAGFQGVLFPKSFCRDENSKQDLIEFKNFPENNSDGLPREFDFYTGTDQQGSIESFQEEYLKARARDVRKLPRKTEDTPALKKFKKQIRDSAISFDREWIALGHRRDLMISQANAINALLLKNLP